jgi:hypothetical protein
MGRFFHTDWALASKRQNRRQDDWRCRRHIAIRRPRPRCLAQGMLRANTVKGCLGISAKVRIRCFFQGRAGGMTEPDSLNRKVLELKEWQAVAWRRVADPLTAPFERREIRNHIKESDDELRLYLGMMSERLRFQARSVADMSDGLTKVNFRLLA